MGHEAKTGVVEARKDRPVAIILAVRKEAGGEVRLTVAPITHEPPDNPETSVELSPEVTQSLRLDNERQWIRLDELNRFSWPGFDVCPIPGRPGVYTYGSIPRDVYDRVKAGIIALQKVRALSVVPRG